MLDPDLDPILESIHRNILLKASPSERKKCYPKRQKSTPNTDKIINHLEYSILCYFHIPMMSITTRSIVKKSKLKKHCHKHRIIIIKLLHLKNLECLSSPSIFIYLISPWFPHGFHGLHPLISKFSHLGDEALIGRGHGRRKERVAIAAALLGFQGLEGGVRFRGVAKALEDIRELLGTSEWTGGDRRGFRSKGA